MIELNRTLGAVYGFFGGGLVSYLAFYLSGFGSLAESASPRFALVFGLAGFLVGLYAERNGRS